MGAFLYGREGVRVAPNSFTGPQPFKGDAHTQKVRSLTPSSDVRDLMLNQSNANLLHFALMILLTLYYASH